MGTLNIYTSKDFREHWKGEIKRSQKEKRSRSSKKWKLEAKSTEKAKEKKKKLTGMDEILVWGVIRES